MRAQLIALVLSIAASSVAAPGCATQTSDDGSDAPVSDEAAITFSLGPEGLAQWLGTNHSLQYMTQYLDTRNGPEGGLLPTYLCCDGSYATAVTFPKASYTSDIIKSVLRIGRKFDAANAKISVGYPQGPGVWVYADKAYFDAYTKGQQLDPAQTFTVALTEAESTVVVAFIPEVVGDETMYVNFGIVKRALTFAANSPTNSYWTMRGVYIAKGAYDTVGEGDGDGNGGR